MVTQQAVQCTERLPDLDPLQLCLPQHNTIIMTGQVLPVRCSYVQS